MIWPVSVYKRNWSQLAVCVCVWSIPPYRCHTLLYCKVDKGIECCVAARTERDSNTKPAASHGVNSGSKSYPISLNGGEIAVLCYASCKTRVVIVPVTDWHSSSRVGFYRFMEEQVSTRISWRTILKDQFYNCKMKYL